MIGYITLGTNNFDRAAAFYDTLLAEIDAGRFMQDDSFIAWATAPDQPGFSIIKPWDGKPASVGNGTMIALMVDGTDKVDAMYNKAIELGASDEGKPGLRGGGFYAAYFRDLDGNKLNFFSMETPEE